MDRLKREGNPPVGQLASPVPQYKDVLLDDWAELQGEGGASYVKDRDVLAKLIEVQSELEVVKAELAAMHGMLETGNAKVTLSGSNVTIDEAWIQDVTVTAGSTVLVGKTGNLSSRRITFAASERAQATHKFWVGYRPKLSGSTTSLIDGPIRGGESSYHTNYVHFNVEAPQYYVYIKNDDTVDHTYNVYKYEFAN